MLVADYVQKARVASPEMLIKARQYIHVGYQRLLTFEVKGGGFDWCGHGPAVIWLTAYGVQEFADMKKVYDVDPKLIERTQAWLMRQQAGDGTWADDPGRRGVNELGRSKLVLTSYVAWSLLESGLRDGRLASSIDYIRQHLHEANDNGYVLALAANALAAWDPKDPATLDALRRLDQRLQEKPDWNACYYPAGGQTLTYATGASGDIETTALTVLALMKTSAYPHRVSQALTYLVKSKDANGTWGSTSATILALKALVAGLGNLRQEAEVGFAILVNGQEVEHGKVTPFNADVMQLFDLQKHTQPGKNDVAIRVHGQTNLMYQIVGRHYEPWGREAPPARPILAVDVAYDRRQLTTADTLNARATVRYQGDRPTFMVILDLGIPPGFVPEAEGFSRLVAERRIEKFTTSPRQITLYLSDMKPGETLTFDYRLRPLYPVKAQAPGAVVYEYYTPAHRATARPVELTVTGKEEK